MIFALAALLCAAPASFAGAAAIAPAQFTLAPPGAQAAAPSAGDAPAHEFHEPTALKGTIIGPKTRIAMLYDGQTQSVAQFRVGEIVAGWRLSEVAHDFVRLEKDGRQLILSLPGSPGPESAPMRQGQ